MARKGRRSTYTNEFKEEAVKLVVEQGYTVGEVAADLGIHPALVTRWKREMGELKKPSNKELPVDDKDKRIKELEKENQRLKMERDFLKKAATFFANDSD
jgi:transposase